MRYGGQRKVLIKYNEIKMLHEGKRVEKPIKQVLKKVDGLRLPPIPKKFGEISPSRWKWI